MLPTVLSTYPSNINIFQVGSFDILWRKIGSEVLKKEFSLFLEKLSVTVTVSYKTFSVHCIPTLGKEDKFFSWLRALNTWLTSACFSSWMKFIDKLLLELQGLFLNCCGWHKCYWIQTAQHLFSQWLILIFIRTKEMLYKCYINKLAFFISMVFQFIQNQFHKLRKMLRPKK